MNIKNITYLALVAVFLASCVSSKKYKELETLHYNLKDENRELSGVLQEAEDNLARLEGQLEDLNRQLVMLKVDTAKMTNQIWQLTREKEDALRLIADRDEETRQILSRYQMTQGQLQAREDEIIAKEENLRLLMLEFEDKEARVMELEAILGRQEEIVNNLRQSVSNALLGFENNGLTIEVKNGKVYVSLEESLLFASGSTTVDRRGETALKELARVLESNPEINVMIEGHTDDVPLRPGSAIRDNWDLSVLRATAIVRILKSSANIDPQRFVVAGRGEHLPVDPENTPEARRKNRRTEIILTPKLDELFKIIEMN